jgi:MFS family permease
MGGSTFAIGFLPSYEQIGIYAPLLLVTLRALQGLALGGEYGGAATYVAEHAPHDKRGYFTSFIQTTATLGLFVSLAVILLTKLSMSKESFLSFGWRIPFFVSIVLVILSLLMRSKLDESPTFAKLKAEGKLSKNPLKESFTNKENLRMVLITLFGATAGQGVVWYTGQFYALSFLQKILKVDFVQSNIIVAIGLLLATPLFVFFGSLSDKIGRKKIMLSGMLLAAFLYIPIYMLMNWVSINYSIPAEEGTILLTTAGLCFMVILIFIQVVFVTMAYGPIAAFLVELFPTRIRYTSMSLPYHIGNGVFGGLTPFIATAVVASTTNIYAGLVYPICIALMTVIVGSIFVKERYQAHLDD